MERDISSELKSENSIFSLNIKSLGDQQYVQIINQLEKELIWSDLPTSLLFLQYVVIERKNQDHY